MLRVAGPGPIDRGEPVRERLIPDSSMGADGAHGGGLALAAAAVLGAAFVVLAVLVVGGGPLPIDTSIRSALGVGGTVPLVLQALTAVGGAITWDIGVAIVVVVLFLVGRRREAAWLGGGVLAGEALSTAAKLIVDRQRPPGISVQDLVTQASYPSGHAIRALLTGALLVLLLTRSGRARVVGAIAAAVLAVLMGLSRIVAGEHWPTDVVGADLLGGAILAVVVAVPVRFRTSAPVPRQPLPLASPDAARRP
jgi:membrane-associated phospholipid phosphatase